MTIIIVLWILIVIGSVINAKISNKSIIECFMSILCLCIGMGLIIKVFFNYFV
ncbi:MAG: hypothetical protein ACRDBY_14070 [Cetobacterium sp.]